MPELPHSLRGLLLLDGGKLRGSSFHRAVVLICHHDSEGAFGLILNQPTPKKLAEAIDVSLPEGLEEAALFAGGPVQPSALSYLHRPDSLPVENLMDGLHLGHDLEELVALARSGTSLETLRVFAGYAGWAPGQLDDEMRRDSWLTYPATFELVFHADPDSLWKRILRERADWQSRLLADSPEDLSWN